MKALDMIQNVSGKMKHLIDDYWVEPTPQRRTLKDEIEEAKKEWFQAQNYFQNVTDPGLVDHAVYLLEAAEAKYTYLLKRAREYVNV